MNYEDYKSYYTKQEEGLTSPKMSDNYKVGKRTQFFKDYHPPKLTEENILNRIKDLSERVNSAFYSSSGYTPSVSGSEIIKLLDYVHNLIVKLRDNEDQITIAVGDDEVIIDGDLATSVIQHAVQAYVVEALTDAVEIDQEINEAKK